MNVDALPLWVLALLAAGAWAVYALVISSETLINGSQSVRHRKADHTVQDSGTDEDAHHPHDDPVDHVDCLRHGGIVHPAPVTLPPGIPSITERLDRWKD